MSLYVASLNSGSNGNCYYISNGDDAILIDAGISCREIEKRMRRLGLSVFGIKAVFISHEHIDHIKGVSVLSKRYNLPVYISRGTLQNSYLDLDSALVRHWEDGMPVQINDMLISAFTKQHDAADPYSFIIQRYGVTVGVFTDIGIPCTNLIDHFRQCHAAFLEANYDEVMLENGRYPLHLKRRIRGGKGHLSNAQALDVFKAHKPAYMSHLFLSHLSKENNDPQLVADLFSNHARGAHIVVASRYEESALYHINADATAVNQLSIPIPPKARQISLF